MMLKRDKTI